MGSVDGRAQSATARPFCTTRARTRKDDARRRIWCKGSRTYGSVWVPVGQEIHPAGGSGAALASDQVSLLQFFRRAELKALVPNYLFVRFSREEGTMLMTAVVYFLYFVVLLFFGLVPLLIWGVYVEEILIFRKRIKIKDCKQLIGKSLIEAQTGSIKYHNLATALNSAGLGCGIVAVFWGGTIDPRFLTLGIVIVLGSIIAFLVFEWVAAKYDKVIAQLAKEDAGVKQLEMRGKLDAVLVELKNLDLIRDYDAQVPSKLDAVLKKKFDLTGPTIKVDVDIPRLKHLELGPDKLIFIYHDKTTDDAQ